MTAEKTLPAIRVRGLTRRFLNRSGRRLTAFERITFDAPGGAFLSIVGPSGCGKSTLLNVIAGLLEPSEGEVAIFGKQLLGINRKASYVFQQDALLPWKTVSENIEIGLRIRGDSVQKSRKLASEWVERIGLSGFADHYPEQLSGGMRKRVAVAQAWIVEPQLVLMDEPFAALDVHLRQQMETEILSLWSRTRETVLFVTHDLEEAISLSDQVVVMSAGPASRIVAIYQIDLPRPRNLIDMKIDPSFVELYRTIWGALRGEVLRGHEISPNA